MANLAKYVVQLELESARYQRELDKSNKKLARFEAENQRLTKSIKTSFVSLGASAKSLGAAFGIAFGAAGLVAATRAIVDAGLKMGRFNQQLTFASGNVTAGAADFQFLHDQANRLGLALETVVGGYARLAAAARGTSLAPNARGIFVGVAEAAAALNLSSDQFEGALTAIEQMISKGNVQAEELRGQLGERLPGAFQIAARAMGVTTQQLDKMLKSGQVTAADMLPKLAEELHKTFGSTAVAAANSATASFNKFATAIFDLKAAIADSGFLDGIAAAARYAAKVVEAIAPSGEIDKLDAQYERASDRLREVLAAEAEIREKFEPIYQDANGQAAYRVEVQSKMNDLVAQEKKLREEMTGLLEKRGALSAKSTGTPDALAIAAPAADAASLSLAARLTEAVQTSTEQAIEQWHQVLDAKAKGLISDETVRRWQDKLLQPIEVTAERLPEILKPPPEISTEWTSFGESLGRGLEDSLADAFMGAEVSFGDMLKRMAAQAAASGVLRALAGLGGPVGAVAGFLGFGGARAEGGSVSPGKSYLVGERGPEIFEPSAAGHIVPNGGGGVAITQVFNVQAGLPPQWMAQLAVASQAAANAAFDATQKRLTGRR